jgi:hypothetical protein
MSGYLAVRSAEFVAILMSEAVGLLSSSIVRVIGEDAPDPGPRAVPRDLRLWLGRLRLLAAVPFGHLVADASLLPAESIRFFYLDRDWTDALVQGALSVGTVTTADRAALTQLHGVVRDEIDEAERLVRLPGVEPGGAVPTGPAGTISGFVLRSRLVSGWPALHVRGYGVDNLAQNPPVPDDEVGDEHDEPLRRLGLLRMERLAPAVLLVLFDGVPSVVHVEEPRAGIQFGVEEQGMQLAGTVRLTLDRIRPIDVAAGVRFHDPLSRTVLRTTTATHGEDAFVDVPVESVGATTAWVGAGTGLELLDPVPNVVSVAVQAMQPVGAVQAEVFLRNKADGRRIEPPVSVDVPFRPDVPGVMHLQALAGRMTAADPTLGTLDAAEFALQMLQFPFRAVFGDRTLAGQEPIEADALFSPKVSVAQLLHRFEGGT